MHLASEWTNDIGRLVVLSGAGISTDSGIADFRGPAGAWTLDPAAQHKYTYRAFLADAALRDSYWASRRAHPVWRAEPNAGHRAVASLAGSAIDTTVVTQNTDGLHQRAGADRVLELHGTMHETLCVSCGHRVPTVEVLGTDAAPHCERCGGILKTASTMFGQTMPPSIFAAAEQAVLSCDLLLAVGTTLRVEPAGSLCASAVRAGARLVIINRDPTPYDSIATELIREPIGEALPRVAGELLAAPRPSANRSTAARPELVEADLVTAAPSVLVRLLADTTPEQDRWVLTILCRAGRPVTELLSVLPGLAPAAVDVALAEEEPGPLVEALLALARDTALPAEMLAVIPAGNTVFGEFPVLLAESLVEAYEHRIETYGESALRGLARTLTELAERLADLGRAEESRAVAERAAQVAERLPVSRPPGG